MEEKSGESSFVFATDAQGEAYCLEIVDLMVSLFEIPYQEAIGRVNRAFSKVQIVGDDMIYHEDPDYWARQI